MAKLFTQVEAAPLPFRVSLRSRVTVLGSCFADEVGKRMSEGGFDVVVNPFGTLYNPASIAAAVGRLDSARPFGPEDCVQLGAGSELVCSHSHHTSFARPTAGEFLSNANAALEKAADHWKDTDTVLVTLGTAFVWRLAGSGGIVANCLKRPACEFTRGMLSVEECRNLLEGIVARHPEKNFIFTVSPIRHLADGAHANTISKATLQLATSGLCYFPAYEILLDELRDYRFYADDLVHPAKLAAEIVWERFLETAVPSGEHERIRLNRKEAKKTGHIPFRQ